MLCDYNYYSYNCESFHSKRLFSCKFTEVQCNSDFFLNIIIINSAIACSSHFTIIFMMSDVGIIPKVPKGITAIIISIIIIVVVVSIIIMCKPK